MPKREFSDRLSESQVPEKPKEIEKKLLDSEEEKKVKEYFMDAELLAHHRAEVARLEAKLQGVPGLSGKPRITAPLRWKEGAQHKIAYEILVKHGPLRFARIRTLMYENGFVTTSNRPSDVISQALEHLQSKYHLAINDKTEGVWRLMTEEERATSLAEAEKLKALSPKKKKGKAKKQDPRHAPPATSRPTGRGCRAKGAQQEP